MILQYAKELSSTIIEEAALLAKHRGVNEMSVKDVKLILGKILKIYEISAIFYSILREVFK